MKKLYILFLAATGLLIAAYIFVRFFLQADIRKSKNKAGTSSGSHRNPDSTLDLRPLFIAKIQQLVDQGSKGLYKVTIDSMEVDLLQSRVVLQRVRLLHDSKMLALLHIAKEAPDDVFTASFDTMAINGINLDDLLTQKNIDLEEILISGPTIEVFHTDRPYNNGSKKPDSISLFDRIMKDMNRIAVSKVVIRKGTFISNDQRKNKKNKFGDVEINFTDILIDSSTEHSKDRFLFAREASISFKNYSLKTKDDLYLFKIGAIAFQAPQQTMTIRNLSLESLYNKKEFQRKLVHQKEQYEVKAPRITIKDVDWWALMHEERFIAGSVLASDAVIKIHLDRSLPRPKSKMGNFPHQIIAKLPMEISAASLAIRNTDKL